MSDPVITWEDYLSLAGKYNEALMVSVHLINNLSKYEHLSLLEEYRPIKQELWKARKRLQEILDD